jgi:hypothetical protein
MRLHSTELFGRSSCFKAIDKCKHADMHDVSISAILRSDGREIGTSASHSDFWTYDVVLNGIRT